MSAVNRYATVAATPTPASSRNGRCQSAPPRIPPSRVPASVPAPCDRPHRLITRPRRRGEIRSLTTEYPTEPTAPRPMLATSCAARNAGHVVAYEVASRPTAHNSVPSMSSGLRLVRSPQYAQHTPATARTRKHAAVPAPTTLSPTPRSRLIGETSGGTRPIATLSSDASTMNTTTLYVRRTGMCATQPWRFVLAGYRDPTVTRLPWAARRPAALDRPAAVRLGPVPRRSVSSGRVRTECHLTKTSDDPEDVGRDPIGFLVGRR